MGLGRLKGQGEVLDVASQRPWDWERGLAASSGPKTGLEIKAYDSHDYRKKVMSSLRLPRLLVLAALALR